MAYFVVTIKRILMKELIRLVRNNVWELHGFLESVILDRGL